MSQNNDRSRPIHEVISLIEANCFLQVKGVDVAYIYMYGAPGGGKTASLEDMCRKNNWGMLSTHFALKLPEELGGIPNFVEIENEGEKGLGTVWSCPDVVTELKKRAVNYTGENQLLVWLMDDVHLMSAQHNAYMYELLTNRKLRDYKLPPNVAMVFAGNHGDSKAGAKNMFSATTNRMAMMPVRSSFDAWKNNYAMKAGIHPAIVSFLDNDQYRGYFHEEEQVSSPWGSPRSWTRLANVLTHLEKWYKELPSDKVIYLAEAHVGPTAASEFHQYYKVYTKFNIPDILSQGEKYRLPEKTLDRYALTFAMMAYYFGHHEDNKILNPFCQIVRRYIKDATDLGTVMIQELIQMEKIMGKKVNYFAKVVNELNKIEPGITQGVLKQLGDAE